MTQQRHEFTSDTTRNHVLETFNTVKNVQLKEQIVYEKWGAEA